MNTERNEQDATDRPIGYWLRAVDARITDAFASALHGEGVTRRDWMLLNVLSGDVDAPGFAERIARKGKRLRGLEERGWVAEQGDGTWGLTDDGRAAKVRLAAIVEGIRERVAASVSPEDFATTVASLEAIARELGWDETTPDPRRGLGRRFGRGLGPRHGFGPDHECGHGHGSEAHAGRDGWHRHHTHDGLAGHVGPENPHHRHAHRGHSHDHPAHRHEERRGRRAEHAYERGFEAGFARGRTDA